MHRIVRAGRYIFSKNASGILNRPQYHVLVGIIHLRTRRKRDLAFGSARALGLNAGFHEPLAICDMRRIGPTVSAKANMLVQSSFLVCANISKCARQLRVRPFPSATSSCRLIFRVPIRIT